MSRILTITEADNGHVTKLVGGAVRIEGPTQVTSLGKNLEQVRVWSSHRDLLTYICDALGLYIVEEADK